MPVRSSAYFIDLITDHGIKTMQNMFVPPKFQF